MTTWVEFREMIARSRLDDADLAYANYTKPLLLDCLKAALDTLCTHTAVEKSETYSTGDAKPVSGNYDMAVDLAFTLPSDVFDPLDTSGLVAVLKPNTRAQYLDAVARTPGKTPMNANQCGYYLWPEGVLNLSKVAGIGSTLDVKYFAYYPYPTADGDTLAAPHWAETPLSYLVAAHALSSPSVASAGIDRFKDKFDAGQPEQNALRVQQNQFFKLYEMLMAKRQPQDRVNYFRENLDPTDTY